MGSNLGVQRVTKQHSAATARSPLSGHSRTKLHPRRSHYRCAGSPLYSSGPVSENGTISTVHSSSTDQSSPRGKRIPSTQAVRTYNHQLSQHQHQQQLQPNTCSPSATATKRYLVRKLSSRSHSARSLQSPTCARGDTTIQSTSSTKYNSNFHYQNGDTMERSTSNIKHYHTSQLPPQPSTMEKDRRILEAEKILEEIAKEYAAKRAAGLVPTKPVPARTLLWEELSRSERNGIGRRGQCLFGRDTGTICGCTSYKKLKRLPDGRENSGGICECCNHGGPWHRLTGGGMMSRSIKGSRSRTGSSSARSQATSSARSRPRVQSGSGRVDELDELLYDDDDEYDDDEYVDENDYDYDDEDYDDEDEDDDDIALEMARPYGYGENMYDYDQASSTDESHMGGHFGDDDRTSMFSDHNDSDALTPVRLSAATSKMELLLQTIQKYREMGMSEEQVETRIRQDFPPEERLSSARSNPPVRSIS